MNRNDITLNMESDAFNVMRHDFNEVMNTTLRNMAKKDSDFAEVTVKLKITLMEAVQPIDGSFRNYTRPHLSHKISSVMQVRDEKSGAFTGDYELVLDKETKEYVMRPVDDEQMSLFDREDDGESFIAKVGRELGAVKEQSDV